MSPLPGRDPQSLAGVLLGMAVGDAMGLPYEGMSRQRVAKLAPDQGRHGLLWGRGLCSDDTEHACLTALALLRSRGDEQRFIRHLAWGLRFWFMMLPAGVGMATARACIKLWLGWPAHASGVFSAGNGPAMRAPVLGVMLGDDPRLLPWVRLATRLTHTDPLAEQGAWTMAWAAWLACSQREATPAELLDLLSQRLAHENFDHFLNLTRQVAASLARGDTTAVFAAHLGLERGVTGFMGHTVPVVLHAWLSHLDDYAGAVWSAVHLGGDTDTVAGLVGSLAGARLGVVSIPAMWLDHLLEWPNSPAWITTLAHHLALGMPLPPSPRGLAFMIRNPLFLILVLAHGFRRLLPPYG